jgi:peptidyl-prolyl cis-trans isomerase B (cyclophilin B)
MKQYLLIVLFFIRSIMSSEAQDKDHVVTIKTKYGDMVAILYNETPRHKENFIKLAKEHFFDSTLFHRVIKDFMIQGGDPDSKKAKPGDRLGTGGPGYTVEAEFNPKFFHEKGALSAARMGDNVNPTKASSGSQFYVVQGQKMNEEALAGMEKNVQYGKKNQYLREIITKPEHKDLLQTIIQKQQSGDQQWMNSFFESADTLIQKEKPDYKPFKFSDEQRQKYSQNGGAPHLDGEYTVFGKVIQGLEVIDKIAEQPRDASDRPTEDIRITVTVEELSKRKIEKLYGYVYPDAK